MSKVIEEIDHSQIKTGNSGKINRMKNYLWCFILGILLSLGCSLHAGQVTIIGKKGQLDLDKYPISVYEFPGNELQKLTRVTVVRVSQKIDESQLVILGPGLNLGAVQNIFGRPEIRLALKNFLRNGGTLFVNTQRWGFYGSSGPVNSFLTEAGLPIFDKKKYMHAHPESKPPNYKTFTGKINPEFKPAWAKVPNKNFELKSVFSFVDIAGTPYQVVVKDNKFAQPMVIEADNIFGKGRIIFSFSYDILRRGSHPFMLNLLTSVFGPLKKTSTKEYLRHKLGLEPQNRPEASKPVILDLRRPVEVSLSNFKDTRKISGTRVKARVENGRLNVTYVCTEPDTAKLKIAGVKRDQPVYAGDSVELMLSPGNRNSDDFYHIIVNPRGVVFDEKNGIPGWNPKYDCSATIGKNSWTVKLSIPLNELGIAGKPFFMINFGRWKPKPAAEISSWTRAKHFSHRTALTGWAVLDDPEKLYAVLKPSRKSSTGKVTLWQLPAFERVYQDTFPGAGAKDVKRISFIVAQNDKECRQLLISNTTRENLYFRVEPNYQLSNNGGHFSRTFEFAEVIPWKSPLNQVYGTGIAKLNSAGIISVPSMETRQLWLNAKTNLPPGKYNWSFKLVPTNSRDLKPQRIYVDLEVVNLRYPDVLPIEGYAFGPLDGTPFFPRGDKYTRRNYLLMAKNCHMTMIQNWDFPGFMMSDGKPSDNLADYITQDDELCRQLNLKYVTTFSLWNAAHNILKRSKAGVTQEETEKILEKLLVNKYAALKKYGYDPKRYYITFIDEPSSGNIDLLIKLARMAHKLTPDFVVGSDIANWSTQNDLQKLKPYIDFWMPHMLRFSATTADAEKKFFRELGKPWITYTCDEQCAILDNIRAFRSKGINHHLLGASGIGIFAFNIIFSNDWYPNGKSPNTFLVHHGDLGPVPTVHAEALREAFEDMYLLRLAEKSSDPEVKALSSPEYLKKVKNTTNGAAKAYQDWRDKLTRCLGGKNKTK